jgi:hypothetical protein
MMPRVSRVGSMGFPFGGWFITFLLYFFYVGFFKVGCVCVLWVLFFGVC